MPTIKEIIQEYLEKNGYDGLYCQDERCACLIGDLMPCGEPSPRCTPGYRGACIGDNYECEGECDYHIYGDKAEALAADAAVAKEEAVFTISDLR